MKLSIVTFVSIILTLSSVSHSAILYGSNGLQIWNDEYHVSQTVKSRLLDNNPPERAYLQRINITKDVKLKNGKQSSQLVERIDNVKQLDGNACVIHQTINQVEQTYNYADCRVLSKLIQTKLPDYFIQHLQIH